MSRLTIASVVVLLGCGATSVEESPRVASSPSPEPTPAFRINIPSPQSAADLLSAPLNEPVPEGLTADEMGREIRKRWNRIKRCYERELLERAFAAQNENQSSLNDAPGVEDRPSKPNQPLCPINSAQQWEAR